MAFCEDITIGGILYHTLFVANDNDFIAGAGDNQFFVFGFTDADLATFGADIVQQQISAVPLPPSFAFMLSGLVLMGLCCEKVKNHNLILCLVFKKWLFNRAIFNLGLPARFKYSNLYFN